jgi:hypothetical protein
LPDAQTPRIMFAVGHDNEVHGCQLLDAAADTKTNVKFSSANNATVTAHRSYVR